ncbi:methyltransferase small domain-containing protein [Diplodia corticola]|uniref:Methyltransferase small domain-containing protein n=1 Tax=Diplodia corticola TaxID=236234 RepID=A0A1J9RQB8_9PEZI|nr:methyltransferase small domain-containing protein [Diplodia corticola]OJD30647.1 methyltransferase small domain-containing protein [Diplodia corticola]
MTQPSLTTTFDTSLIDLAALPGTRQHRRRLLQEKRQQQQSGSQQFGSFSTTEPDTENDEEDANNDGSNGAEDFANDVTSQAVADRSNDFLFSTSGAIVGTPALSSEEEEEDEDEDEEEKKNETTLARPPPSRSPLVSPPPPRQLKPRQLPPPRPAKHSPGPSSATAAATAAPARAPASHQAKRASETPTSSTKHPQPSSSPSPPSPSSPPSSASLVSRQNHRPPSKRRKMARDASPPPSSSSSSPSRSPSASGVVGGGGTPSASGRASASAGRQQPTINPVVGDHAAPGKTATPVRHVDNVAAYDAWAAVYDSDGNILQSVDDLELEAMLPRFLESAVGGVGGGGADGEVFRVLDLGCGTGRNTEKVVRWWEEAKGEGKRKMEVTGVDASKGMLGKAKERLIPLVEDSDVTTLNLLNLNPFTAALPVPLLRQQRCFHAVISTLVLEHLPLDSFFRTLAALLAPGAVALVTNMHPDMGAVSQAGFVSTDAEGKTVKVRGQSWAHGIRETIEAAREVGLVVVDAVDRSETERDAISGVKERSVDEGLINSGKVGERGWKWVGTKVWYGFVVRKAGEEE